MGQVTGKQLGGSVPSGGTLSGMHRSLSVPDYLDHEASLSFGAGEVGRCRWTL